MLEHVIVEMSSAGVKRVEPGSGWFQRRTITGHELDLALNQFGYVFWDSHRLIGSDALKNAAKHWPARLRNRSSEQSVEEKLEGKNTFHLLRTMLPEPTAFDFPPEIM